VTAWWRLRCEALPGEGSDKKHVEMKWKSALGRAKEQADGR
jgi:hypothetical protein